MAAVGLQHKNTRLRAFGQRALGEIHLVGRLQHKNWLYRLAASACTRMRRGQKNDPALHVPLESGSRVAESLGKQADALLTARMLPLRQALSSLTAADRAVLLLRDGEGLTAAETAAELGITEAAVKSRLQRTRAVLREKLDAE